MGESWLVGLVAIVEVGGGVGDVGWFMGREEWGEWISTLYI